MKNKLFLLLLIIFAVFSAQAQSIILEFNANHSCAQVNLDSIWIENLTQGGKMVLYYPDNIAVLVHTHIDDFDTEQGHLYVSQNYPNPFSALTYIDVYLAMPDVVSLNVYDLKGRTIAMREDKLEEGMHRFSFSAGAKTTYILNVTTGKQVEKRIMLQMGTTGSAVSRLSYLGAGLDNAPKTAPFSSDFSYAPGDDLRFTGYVTDLAGNIDYGVIDDTPETSTEYLFDIANTPPDQPSEISGEMDVPENATGLVYEVEEIAGLTYQWSVPDGWEITQGQGSYAITVNADSEGGEISVKAENNCGMSETRVLFVDAYAAVTDIDGNVYRTVIIGNQEWMAENLRVTRDANGNNITRYCYDNNENNCVLHGGLYSWHTVMNGQSSSNSNPSGVQGICPAGWHVPSDAEWWQLVYHVAGQGYLNDWNNPLGAGNALKSCRQVDSPHGGDCDTSEHPRWNFHNTHQGFDEFGFSGLPNGYRLTDGSFNYIGIIGIWWSSTEIAASSSWSRSLDHNTGRLRDFYYGKNHGFSVRCVRDDD
jgi:uncharacterized protein (TIGR02145 family)